ncbi:50S ribosomal protein L4 [Desulfococcaceae bacterium HSG7]|nr:50S ribosomal protein L4 [Desulfococcaceae bacterium HSG9]MDM8553773.1 50S ribosomal protein L4 [Desulfococcaceae bacterium HSG7]
MATVDVKNIKSETVSQIELADVIFSITPDAGVLHEMVRMQLACKRAGTASVKHRSDVKGSGKKLFRQKGTGRARRGDIKDPLLRGGGSIFGPDPKSYSYKMPKKKKRLALKMALSAKLQENELIVLNEFELDQIKTKKFVDVLNAFNIKNALIVTDKTNETLELSSRNVPDVKVMRFEGLNVYDILKHRCLILLEPSVKAIEGRLLV